MGSSPLGSLGSITKTLLLPQGSCWFDSRVFPGAWKEEIQAPNYRSDASLRWCRGLLAMAQGLASSAGLQPCGQRALSSAGAPRNGRPPGARVLLLARARGEVGLNGKKQGGKKNMCIYIYISPEMKKNIRAPLAAPGIRPPCS